MREIPGITPLRAFAAGLVLLSHVAFWTGASTTDGIGRLLARGDAGVAVFFAITAFLLLRPASSSQATWPPNRYATKRFARIVPAYWAALLAVLAVAPVTAGGLGSPAKIVEHIFLLQGFTNDAYQGFTQTWSLTTEVCFYLLVPFLGQTFRRWHENGRAVPTALVVFAILGVLIQVLCAAHPSTASGPIATSGLGHAAWFVAGAQVLFARTRGTAARISPASTLALAGSTYVLAATPLGGPVGLSAPGAAAAGVKELLYAVFAGCLVHAATAPLTPRLRGLVTSPAAQMAGEISYGVFLWHVLVIQVLFVGIGLRIFHAPFVLVLIPTVLVSCALAWISWQVLERPAISWAHRRTHR